MMSEIEGVAFSEDSTMYSQMKIDLENDQKTYPLKVKKISVPALLAFP